MFFFYFKAQKNFSNGLSFEVNSLLFYNIFLAPLLLYISKFYPFFIFRIEFIKK